MQFFPLYITDLLSEKQWLDKKYFDKLIKEIGLLIWEKIHDNMEWYTQKLKLKNQIKIKQEDQLMAWLLTYLYEIDNDLFNEQIKTSIINAFMITYYDFE